MKSNQEPSTMNKIIKKALIFNTILIIFVLLGISGVAYLDNTRQKIVFDGVELSQSALEVLRKEGGKTYINIDKLLKLNQMKRYKINNGTYLSKNIDDSFYIDSVYEAVQFNEKSQEYTKYIKYEYLDRELDENAKIELTEEEKKTETKEPKKRDKTKMDETISNEEKFVLKNPIMKKDNQKYLSVEDARYAFNIDIKEVDNGRILQFKTIKYLEQGIAGYLKSENLSLNNNYQNRRSIIDGYFSVVGAGNKNGIYFKKDGVNNVVAIKYDDLRYAQDTKSVYCIADKQIGIVDIATGNEIISFDNYDIMEVYSSEKGLYKIGKNGKQGIINKTGKKVVPIEYDEIGYDVEDFPGEKDGKILLDNIIPIRKENKWGLKRIDTDLPIEPVFDKIGYKKLKYAPKNQNGKITIPQEDIEKLKVKEENKKKKSNNSNSSSSISISEFQRELSEAEALKLGYTSNSSLILDGEENVLTLPKETGYEGIVVKTQEGKYGIVMKEFDRKTVQVFALAPNEDRIYKIVDNGVEKYFRYQNHNKSKSELKRENRVFDDNRGTPQQNPPSVKADPNRKPQTPQTPPSQGGNTQNNNENNGNNGTQTQVPQSSKTGTNGGSNQNPSAPQLPQTQSGGSATPSAPSVPQGTNKNVPAPTVPRIN